MIHEHIWNYENTIYAGITCESIRVYRWCNCGVEQFVEAMGWQEASPARVPKWRAVDNAI